MHGPLSSAPSPFVLLVALALLASCASAPSPEPEAGDGDGLRVATWNVERLFDAECDSGRCGAGDYEAHPSPAELRQTLDRVARAIAALDADVVLLQEVETCALLDALADRMEGRYPHRVFGERGRAASLDVGVLSALPVVEVREHGGETLRRPDGSATSFTREVLELHLRDPGGDLLVFAAHLKSKRDDDPGRRLAEAARLGELAHDAARRLPDARVVIGGDLNDIPGSEPLRALEAASGLHRIGGLLPPGGDATYAYEGIAEALDHLLVSGEVLEDLSAEDVAVMGDAARGYAGSDHAALTLRLPPRLYR